MSLNEYMTTDDITNVNFKSFAITKKQEYIDRVNDFYESLAISKNMKVEDIAYPIQLLVKEMLQYKVNMDMAFDAITGSSTNNGASKYDVIYSLNRDQYLVTVKQVNTGLISGTNNSATSTFKMIETVRG